MMMHQRKSETHHHRGETWSCRNGVTVLNLQCINNYKLDMLFSAVGREGERERGREETPHVWR